MYSLWKTAAVAAVAIGLVVLPAMGQSTIKSAPTGNHLIEAYVAQIGRQDLYNSNGVALSHPWQVLRQDRANFHRFGIRDSLDEGDTFFGSAENRAIMESMLARGSISTQAARDIMRGNALVLVEIYGTGTVGRSVQVTVAR